jgi:hypothetical protein
MDDRHAMSGAPRTGAPATATSTGRERRLEAIDDLRIGPQRRQEDVPSGVQLLLLSC